MGMGMEMGMGMRDINYRIRGTAEGTVLCEPDQRPSQGQRHGSEGDGLVVSCM